MKLATWATASLLSIFVVSTATAGGGYDFEFTAPAGAIGDDRTSFYPLTMDASADPELLTLELVLTGLTHSAPWDLDIYLLDPFGNSLLIQNDRGDMNAVSNLTMVFNDTGSTLPADPDTALGAGPWRAAGGDFIPTFQFRGTDAWILVINDDSPGNVGTLESWSLRGTVVPEPVTLSLLAIGALTALRRRRN